MQESVSRDEVETLAWDKNWHFENEQPRSDHHPFDTITWITAGGQTVINYVDDYIINVRYLVIDGPESDTIVQQVRSALATYSNADIQRKFKNAQNRESRITAIYQLAIAAPQTFDEQLNEQLESVFADPDPQIRHAAIVAVGYIGWPELRQKLEQLKISDPESSIRHDAELMLEALARQAQSPDKGGHTP